MVLGISQLFRSSWSKTERSSRRRHDVMSPETPVADGNDYIRKVRPRVVQIVLRRPRRVIRVRVIKPEKLGAQLARAPLGRLVILRPHQEPPPRALFRRVRQRERPERRRRGQSARRSIRSDTSPRHARESPHPRAARAPAPLLSRTHRVRARSNRAAVRPQNRSDKYFSPPSGKITTMTASGERRATLSAPPRFAPLEIPTNRPSRASRRVRSNASSRWRRPDLRRPATDRRCPARWPSPCA